MVSAGAGHIPKHRVIGGRHANNQDKEGQTHAYSHASLDPHEARCKKGDE